MLPGGLGTLEEMFEIWVSAVLAMHRKPIVVLDPDGVFDPLHEQVARLVELGFVHPASLDVVGWVRGVAEAFELIERPERLPRATI